MIECHNFRQLSTEKGFIPHLLKLKWGYSPLRAYKMTQLIPINIRKLMRKKGANGITSSYVFFFMIISEPFVKILVTSDTPKNKNMLIGVNANPKAPINLMSPAILNPVTTDGISRTTNPISADPMDVSELCQSPCINGIKTKIMMFTIAMKPFTLLGIFNVFTSVYVTISNERINHTNTTGSFIY